MNVNIYLPLLKEFCDKGGIELIEKCGYDQGPFIPYTFGHYDSAPLKIFYMGIDTYYWVPIDVLKKAFLSNTLESYLTANMSAMTRDMIFNWKNSTSFWGTVARLQLMIRTGKYYDDICNLSESEMNILDEIGYGNIYSIETLDTINNPKKRDLGLSDFETYNSIVELSKPLTKFTTLLSAYKPDIVFLFSWRDYDILNGLDFHSVDSEYDDKFRAVFESPSFNTKLIWTTHPSSFSFKHTNMKEMVEYLSQTAVRLTDIQY